MPIQVEHSTLSLSNLSTGEFMRPVRTQVGHSTPSLSNLSRILPRMLRRMEVGPVKLGEAPNFVQEMRCIGQVPTEDNNMRRPQLKFGYGPKYPSLEVVVKPVETGTDPNICYKPLKTGTELKTYLNLSQDGDPTSKPMNLKSNNRYCVKIKPPNLQSMIRD